MSDLGTEIHLHARVFRAGGDWYADIDDHADPQPDDPFWYGYYPSQQEAMDAACDRIAALHRARCDRISRQLLLRTTTSA